MLRGQAQKRFVKFQIQLIKHTEIHFLKLIVQKRNLAQLCELLSLCRVGKTNVHCSQVVLKKSDQECQAISIRCISDGTHCVKVDDCASCKKQIVIKMQHGNPCYQEATSNTCLDANICDNLPTINSPTTGNDCRNAIIICKRRQIDQTLEIQCFWNQQNKIACYCDGAKCKDRTCDNAPTNLVTDDTCKSFRTDGSCTTKLNGECAIKTICAATTIKEACIQNISACQIKTNGQSCGWNGNSYIDKACSTASKSLTTTLQYSSCVPKNPVIVNGVSTIKGCQNCHYLVLPENHLKIVKYQEQVSQLSYGFHLHLLVFKTMVQQPIFRQSQTKQELMIADGL